MCHNNNIAKMDFLDLLEEYKGAMNFLDLLEEYEGAMKNNADIISFLVNNVNSV